MTDEDVGIGTATAQAPAGFSDADVGLSSETAKYTEPKSSGFTDADVGLTKTSDTSNPFEDNSGPSSTPKTDAALNSIQKVVTNATKATGELAMGMIPKTPMQAAEQAFPILGAARQGAQIATGDVSSLPFVGRVPEIIQAEKTPAGSKERFLTAEKTLMDLALLAGGGEAGRGTALRGEPLSFEPPPTVSMGAGTTAADVSGAVNAMPLPEEAAIANAKLVPIGEPPAPSIEQATEPAPPVREPLSLDELRLMREKNDLQLQNDIAQRMTGGTHPAVDERLGQIDEELTNIANRELQPGGPNAIQEPSTGEIFQRQPEETGGAGGGRGRMEPGVQGQEATGTGQPEPVSAGETVAPETPETANAPQSITAELPQTTALKNEVTAAERDIRNLSPREEVEKRTWDQAKAVADKEAATDPGKGARLVEELNQKPRPLDDVEGVHLLRRKMEVNAEHDAALKALNQNPEDVNAIARFKTASDEAQKVYNATEASGTSWGRGGRIRQAMMAEDYSLGTMEAKTRALTNKGKSLPDAQLSKVVSHYEKISKQAASIKAIESDLQNPSGKLQPTEILKAVEEMKQRLAPCL